LWVSLDNRRSSTTTATTVVKSLLALSVPSDIVTQQVAAALWTYTQARGVSRVLIIDDDPMTTEQFARMLRLDGYEVETTLDGEAGFRAAVSGRFDAVILDLRMPLVDGLELLRQLRKAPTGHNTPVAIVTGDYLIDDATLTEVHQLGAILRYKPLWLEDLTELTRTLVGSIPREDPAH